jgi:hypothetical protein
MRPSVPMLCVALLFALSTVAHAATPLPYVIVTDESLAAAFQPLADAHTSAGLIAEVHTLQEIQAAYPIARDDAERIRNYLKDTFATRSLRFVLLGGEDPLIPIRRALLRTGFVGDIFLATDQYYACLGGTWNADGDSLWGESLQSESDPGDSVNYFPDLAVGRAPVTTVAEAQAFVTKTLAALAAQGSTGPLSALLAGSYRTVDYATTLEQIVPVLQARPNLRVARLYANYPAWPGSYPLTNMSLLDSLQTGYDLAVLSGPGGMGVFEAEPFPAPYVTAANFAALTNPRLTFGYALSAFTTAPGAGSIGRAWVTEASGGAVSLVASTDIQFVAIAQNLMHEFFHQAIELHVPTAGEALQDAIQTFPAPPSEFVRLTSQGNLLFGDPALAVPGSQEVPVATRVALVDAQTGDGMAKLSWFTSAGMDGSVERRTETSDWIVLGFARDMGNGLLTYEDHAPAGRYGYRLRAGEDLSEEAWLTITGGTAGLALAGFRPNPTSGPGVAIALTLASNAPATLDLVDVAGRKVARRDVGALGPGSHVVELGTNLRAGVYWIRLVQGAEVRIVRGVVTH